LLAYDFYTAKIYRVSIVFSVDLISRFISGFDRYLVDGAVNFVGFASLFGGQSLKYSTSGQLQFYAMTIVMGIIVLGMLLYWRFLHGALPLFVALAQ
jgi:NAD(P)H-quinone oxidoreductase subunit 5